MAAALPIEIKQMAHDRKCQHIDEALKSLVEAIGMNCDQDTSLQLIFDLLAEYRAQQ